MSETVKLMIEIPKEEHELIINSEDCGLNTLTRAVSKGTIITERKEEDCISRAEVNQVIEDYMDEQYHLLSDRPRERAFGANAVKARINELPLVTPQQPIHGKCNQCKYYEGVHNVQGHAPCTYHRIGSVMWDWYCSQFDGEIKE